MVAENAGLTEDQKTGLENETLLLVLGIQRAESFPMNIAKTLGISDEKGAKLARAVRGQVILSILPTLHNLHPEEVEESDEEPEQNDETTEETSESGAIHNELFIPPHLEPMIVDQPRKIAVASEPAPMTLQTAHMQSTAPSYTRIKNQLPPIKQVPTPVQPQKTVSAPVIAPEHEEDGSETIDRHDILSAIEDPVMHQQTTPQEGVPSLKNPMPLYDQKLRGPVRSPRQEQKITDPYRETI